MPGPGRLLMVVAATVLGLAVAAAAWWSPPRTAGAAQVSPAVDPRALYLRDCAICHGGDGAGTNLGPTLVGVGRASVDYYLGTGRMPLVNVGRVKARGSPLAPLAGDQLADPDTTPRRHTPAYPPSVIRALVDYVDGLTGGGGPDIPRVSVDRARLARGGELFRLQCAACHAWAGDGGALLHREAPALHRSTPVQIAEAVRVGPGLMPAFGRAALSPSQLDAVVAYVRYLDSPRDRGGEPLWHLGPVAEGAIAWVLGLGVLLVSIRWIGDKG